MSATAPKGLEFDPDAHLYRFAGKPAPGVSEMLSGLNIEDTTRFTDAGRDRGKAIHAALEYHMTGGVDWKTVDQRIMGYIEAGIEWLAAAGVKPGPGTFVEIPLYDPLRRFCGTPDLVCECFGEPSVPDFKSGSLGEAGLRTALYELLARHNYPLPKGRTARRRMAVQLFEDGRYKVTPLGDGFDYSYAESVISLYHRFIVNRKGEPRGNGKD